MSQQEMTKDALFAELQALIDRASNTIISPVHALAAKELAWQRLAELLREVKVTEADLEKAFFAGYDEGYASGYEDNDDQRPSKHPETIANIRTRAWREYQMGTSREEFSCQLQSEGA